MTTPTPTTIAVRANLRSGPTCSKARVVECNLTQPQCVSSLDATCVGHLIHECDEAARWRFDGRDLLQFGCNTHKVDMMRTYPNAVMTPYVGSIRVGGAR